MKFTITNKIEIQDAPGEFIGAVKKRLIFSNPKWLENNNRGYWNGKTPKQLKCYEQSKKGLLIPRGFIRHLIGIAKAQSIRYHLQDHRRTLPEVDFSDKHVGPLWVSARSRMRIYQRAA